MKKNLLIKEAAEQIINRAKELQPGSKAVWGKMNATEMLLHCNRCNEQIFEGGQFEKGTTVKQYLLRILALYIAPRFKKGLHGDPRNETKGKIAVSQFEKERERFIALVGRFPDHKKPMVLPHVAFGTISTREWGIAAYKHMDHHLRQFGV